MKNKIWTRQISARNLNIIIDETNKKISSYWLGLNEFADLSQEEFKDTKKYTCSNMQQEHKSKQAMSKFILLNIIIISRIKYNKEKRLVQHKHII